MVIGKPKTVRLMANIRFGGSLESESKNHQLIVFGNATNEIYMEIYDPLTDVTSWICLDVATAIQFSKQLRKEIAIVKSNIEDNGGS